MVNKCTSCVTLPECFKPYIIEVFIERPSSLSGRSETYSNYKSHNTVKFLVLLQLSSLGLNVGVAKY